jgi:serralysin
MAIFPSSTNTVDALLAGESWTGNSGQPVTIRYTIASNYTAGSNNSAGTFAFNQLQIPEYFVQAVNSVLQAWSRYVNVTFDYQIPSSTNQAANNAIPLIIGAGNITGTGEDALGFAQNFVLGDRITRSNVVITNGYVEADYLPGGLGYITLMHEVGHALGLSHPDTLEGAENTSPSFTGALFNANNMNLDASIMISQLPVYGQFTSQFYSPQTPMVYDIAAMQYLYGARPANAGNTTYAINGSKRVETIFDSGGFDTINTSTFNANVRLDLRESTAPLQVGDSRIWFAPNSRIESATSGNGNDFLAGNTGSNTLIGNAGNDTLDGYGGADSIDGGAGFDILRMTGNNAVNANLLNVSNVTFGSSVIAANFEGVDASLATIAINVTGSTTNDVITGGLGEDTIFGGTGDDVISGGSRSAFSMSNMGADALTLLPLLGFSSQTEYETEVNGFRAENKLFFGRDILHGDAGNDRMLGAAGNDSVRGGQGNDTVQGNQGNDVLYGDMDNDLMRGGRGNDILYGGRGDDSLYGDAGVLDQLRGNLGADRFFINPVTNPETLVIWDFSAAQGDKIMMSSNFYITQEQIIVDLQLNAPTAGDSDPIVAAGFAELTLISAGTTSVVRIVGVVIGTTPATTTLSANDFIIY